MTKKNKPINKKSGTKPKKKAARVSPRRGLTNEQIEQTVRKLFESEPNKVFNYKQVCYLFGQTSMSQKRQVVSVLEALVVFGFLTEVEMGRYRLKHAERKAKGNALEGTFRYFRGNSSVVVEGMEEPLAIEERDAAHALDGDKVRIAQTTLKGRVERKVWQVTKILERSTRTYVGKIKITRQGAFVTNESRDMRMPIQILEEDLGEVEDRDKVIVRVRSWSSRDRNPIGEIVDILGKTGSADAEMHAILAEYGLPYHYPEEVEQAATSLSGEITEEALREREDFRSITTFTIDPRDAKDFDDALSIRKLENGNWEIGVHIADVSHFVRPGDIIDKEAYNRATSVYLVDRTIPMLPEYLSNGLCSLRPNEDKYSYSCIFEMSDDAKVQASRIVRTVICSDRRFTYEEAQEIIERGEGDYAEEILTLNRLAQQIREEI